MPTIQNGFGAFRVGERVRYAVWPHALKPILPGVVTEEGVLATEEWAAYLESQEISLLCEWEYVHDVRVEPRLERGGSREKAEE